LKVKRQEGEEKQLSFFEICKKKKRKGLESWPSKRKKGRDRKRNAGVQRGRFFLLLQEASLLLRPHREGGGKETAVLLTFMEGEFWLQKEELGKGNFLDLPEKEKKK